MSEIQTYTIVQTSDGFLIYFQGFPLLDKFAPKIWSSEKTALQWLRRNAQKDMAKYEVIKIDGSLFFMNYATESTFRLGKHNWIKANVMPLADSGGPYDKLVCSICKKIVRRYKSQRHFREEIEPCEKNLISVEIP